MIAVIILILVFLGIIDNSIASGIIGLVMYLFGAVLLLCNKDNRRHSFRLYNIIFAVYLICAFIVSRSFSVSDYFLVSDSSRYIESYMNSTFLLFDKEDFVNHYLKLSDSNVLYNTYLNGMATYVNKTLGGMTVFGMTLLQTIWGILASLVLFRILARHIEVQKAYRLTLVFAFCSLFLFYSTVIIRDIIICYLYLLAFDIVDQKFKLSGLIKLILIIVATTGIRLYSGFFMITFLAYYIYARMYKSWLRHIASAIFIVVLIVAAGSILASDIVEQTFAEMEEYTELAAERSAGGMVSKLQSLPPGISHIAIVLFTMIRPLPPFSIYIGTETFSHFTMSTMHLIAGCFWFVIFFSLCYQLFVRRYIYKIPFERVVLLLVCLVFMLANASHPDIRRMLPVFPILYVQFVDICNHKNESIMGSGISKGLITCYIIMAFGMLVIM